MENSPGTALSYQFKLDKGTPHIALFAVPIHRIIGLNIHATIIFRNH